MTSSPSSDVRAKKAVIRRHDLGTIAGMYSKKVYIVAEDPGAEPVEQISKDIAQYVEAQHCPYEMIEDRGEAIRKAIMTSEGKSILLITGKGNETQAKNTEVNILTALLMWNILKKLSGRIRRFTPGITRICSLLINRLSAFLE